MFGFCNHINTLSSGSTDEGINGPERSVVFHSHAPQESAGVSWGRCAPAGSDNGLVAVQVDLRLQLVPTACRGPAPSCPGPATGSAAPWNTDQERRLYLAASLAPYTSACSTAMCLRRASFSFLNSLISTSSRASAILSFLLTTSSCS
ncbi:hypothetical protein F7725_019183 [Dissostichus mawsoni]|uniref:Uncharacterized protein n=1 Tax=Dissostichus mawsoni TaxID=36200 RepID=A0A7J5YIZ5_DISMA|nr:hypothetical protein F7725_019183 [Dissostichus mawsoni]